MNEKKLRRMRRTELLELMLAQGREIDRLNARVSELEAQVADRTVSIESAGSLAEASLKLTKVFEEAQRAADIYLHNVRANAAPATQTQTSTSTSSAQDVYYSSGTPLYTQRESSIGGTSGQQPTGSHYASSLPDYLTGEDE